MSIVDQLMERRTKLLDDATAIAQRGVAENRQLESDEKISLDKMLAEAEELANRAQALQDGETRARDLEESFKRATGQDVRKQPTDSGLGKWAREARIGEGFDVKPVFGAEEAARQRVLGFESRAMSATQGVNDAGVYGQLWEYAIAGSELLQAGVQIISTSHGNVVPMPAVTAHATGASAAASAPITASDAGLTLVNLSATKYGYLTLVPSELVDDVEFDLEGYLARAAGRELGKIISSVAGAAATAGFTASGAVCPTASYISPTGAVFTDALIDLFHSVIAPYRAGGAWVASDKGIATTRKAKDVQGGYVWQPALVLGNPGTVDGKPFYNDSLTLSNATVTGTRPVYFGDWGSLAVRVAGGLRFERSEEYRFGNDEIAFRAIVRTGAAVLDVNAVKFMQLTAS